MRDDWPNIVLKLARRLRSQANIKTTLGQCRVFAVMYGEPEMCSVQCEELTLL